jgi:hypothetical protein
MKRLPKRLKYTLLIVGALVGVGLIAAAAADSDASARLERKMAELRAAGQPLSLAELARKPIPPETNAATYLARAKSDLQAIQKEVGAAEDAAEEAGQKDDGRLPGPIVLAAMRSALAAYPNALPLVIQASNCPDYDAQLDYTTDVKTFIEKLLPNFQVIRAAFRALNYRALVSLADGKPDDALENCLTMFRLARLVDRNPTLVTHLVAMAVRSVTIEATNRVLRSDPLPAGAYDALEVEIARQDIFEAYRNSLRTERPFGLQNFRENFGTRIIAVDSLLPASLKNREIEYLECFDVLIDTAARPLADPEAQEKIAAATKSAGTLTQLIIPAVSATREATARVVAQIRTLRVLNAILRRERSGKTDESTLADLGLPADVTIDPYNGKSLILKTSPTGWLVYSVGKDLKDDGGKFDDERTDVGLGPLPPAENETDKK